MEGRHPFKRLTKRLLIAAFSLIVAICSIHFYKAEPISGVVIDESTGLPIAHAVVAATWFSQSPSFHSPNREYFENQEAVADEQGRFTIPGWRLKVLLRWWASIDGWEPALVAYKYGYQPTEISNSGQVEHGFVIRWNGRDKIALTKLEGSPLEIAHDFKSSLIALGGGCRGNINLALEKDKQMQDIEEAYKTLQPSDSDDHRPPDKPWYHNHFRGCKDLEKLIENQRKARISS